jgi:hypothetical protein
MKNVYEEPHEDAVADKALYARLQQELNTRDVLADIVPLSKLIGALPPKPRFVDGRWVLP